MTPAISTPTEVVPELPAGATAVQSVTAGVDASVPPAGGGSAVVPDAMAGRKTAAVAIADASLPAAPGVYPSTRVGSVLEGKWHLDSLLGTGGMGAVYAATHRNGHRVAIKVLHDRYSTDESLGRRLEQEACAANSIGHPGAVRILDDGRTEDGAIFLVMDLLEGEGLHTRLARNGGQISPGDAMSITYGILDVLATAHAKGILHGDIKPENVFITRQGEVKVLDFGIAGIFAPSSRVSEATEASPPPLPPSGEREPEGTGVEGKGPATDRILAAAPRASEGTEASAPPLPGPVPPSGERGPEAAGEGGKGPATDRIVASSPPASQSTEGTFAGWPLANQINEGNFAGSAATGPGVVAASARASQSNEGSFVASPQASLASEGDLFGTPGYMAPEQALGRADEVGPRTDLWAAAATLHRMLTGRHVHESPSLIEQLVDSGTRPAPPFATVMPQADPAVAALMDRGLAFAASERFADARQMQEAVRLCSPSSHWGAALSGSGLSLHLSAQLASPLSAHLAPPLASPLSAHLSPNLIPSADPSTPDATARAKPLATEPTVPSKRTGRNSRRSFLLLAGGTAMAAASLIRFKKPAPDQTSDPAAAAHLDTMPLDTKQFLPPTTESSTGMGPAAAEANTDPLQPLAASPVQPTPRAGDQPKRLRRRRPPSRLTTDDDLWSRRH